MNFARYFLLVTLLLLAVASFVIAEEQSPSPATTEEESGEAGGDSSVGLSEAYAKNYLIAASTLSPNKKFAVIYPKLDSEEFPEGKITSSRCNHSRFSVRSRRSIRIFSAKVMAG